jgi:thiol:disulfide interchange protein
MIKKSLLVLVCLTMIFALTARRQQHATAASQAKYVPVAKYDPSRDAGKDIQEAVAEARRTKKRVLLEVGGDWCIWCHEMDGFFEKNPKLLALREEHFITVKINVSPENENSAALSAYPKIPGYPHIFVLDAEGKLLQSQDTGELEAGRTYDLEKFLSFLKRWAEKQSDK